MDPANKMPDWLDRDYMQSLLRENVKGLFVVEDMKVTAAVATGENYGSQLHRVVVWLKKGGVGEAEDHHLIIKSLPSSELMQKLIVDGDFFSTEISMYSHVLPAMHELEAATSKVPVEPFSCKSYKTSRPNTIVLEDLTKKGYKVAQRHKGLDLDHTKLAIKAMARFHALSLGLLAKDPKFMEPFAERMMVEEKREQNQQMTIPMLNMLASQVEEWHGYERFGERLRTIQWTDRLIELFKINNGPAVLNHGDGWTNNMMFQYSDRKEVKIVKFVDFQLCRYASPGIDIQYFMHTSPNEDVRTKHWDLILQEYHTTFVQTMKSIGCDPKYMSLAKLKKEVDEKLLYGVMAACMVLPIVMADQSDAPNFDNLGDTEQHGKEPEKGGFRNMYNGARFRAVFQKLLKSFEMRGIL